MKLPVNIIALQEQTERTNRLVRPAWLDMREQMERTWAPLRHHLELMEKIKIDSAALRLHEIAESHQRLVDIAQVTKENFRWVEDIKNSHRIWMENIRPLQDSLTHIRCEIEPLAVVSQYLTASERLFAGIDFDAIRQAYTLPDNLVLHTQRTLFNLANRYETLLGSVNTLPDLMKLPAYILPSASREIFTAGYAISRICPVIIEPEYEEEVEKVALVVESEWDVSGSLELLRNVNPALVIPYIGARDALISKSPDRARHIYASLRELWNHLLRELAPDEKVMNWLPKDKDEFLHKGKPTRKARILYICRSINHKPFIEFVDLDTQSLIRLLEFFHRVHELEINISEEQLKAIMLKVDSWLMYILNIWSDGEQCLPQFNSEVSRPSLKPKYIRQAMPIYERK